MKYTLRSAVVLLLILFVTSCSKQEEAKLQLFSPEAFAYDLGDGWEVNSTARVKGFGQTESNGSFQMNVTFAVDLTRPDGSKLTMFRGEQKLQAKDKFADQPLEAQFELDSTFTAGKYKVTFNVTDQISKQTATIEKEMELGAE